MKIIINDSRKLSDIQEEFSTMFPYLKLEFFSKLYKPKSEEIKKSLKNAYEPLSLYRTGHKKKTIIIVPAMTVVDMEKYFNDVYGLGIQVFRKSGRVWLETTLTDSWTLEEQNRQGESLSRK